MDKTINWKALDDKEKVRLILKHVMGYFVLAETTKGFHSPEFQKGVQAPEGFHWPIAFWNTDGECWMYKDIADNSVTFFDPLRDMNAAWLAVKRFTVSVELIYTPGRDTCCKIQPPIGEPVYGIAENPTEAICIATLRVILRPKGTEVLYE